MSRDRSKKEQRQRLADALRRTASGDPAALRLVYEITSAKLFGICLRILSDRQLAKDALQEVYINVWRRSASFDGARGSPITWLATLARNQAIDRLRSVGRHASTHPLDAAFDVADPAPGADARMETAVDRSRLHDCLGELDIRSAGAIRDAFFGGFTYAQLASRAGVPLGTMKSWVRRALIKLRECLER